MAEKIATIRKCDTALQFAGYFKKEWQPYFYILWDKLQDGHICVPGTELEGEFIQSLYPGFKPDELTETAFVSDGMIAKPIVKLNNNYYLHRYFYFETVILQKIKELISHAREGKVDVKKVQEAFKRPVFKDGEPDWQQIAAVATLQNNFTIITGGPGTGKTTTIATILGVLLSDNPEKKVALAAPTGKAAARMAESLQEKAEQFPDNLKELVNRMEPSTIHRLLGSRKGSVHFKHNLSNPLNADVIIIDESSMIDVALFARLLDAIKPETKLILLGDKNQLASVEAGSLFGDLCNVPDQLNVFSRSFFNILQELNIKESDIAVTEQPSDLSDHIVELKKSYRFSSDAGIGKLSKIIIEEDSDALGSFILQGDDIVQIDPDFQEELFDNFITGFEDFISEKDISSALHRLNENRVLCAMREGGFGIYETNRRIESLLEKKKLIRCDNRFYENRPVMMTKNNYSLNLFNGDTGIVRKDKDGNLKVWFEVNGQLIDFSPALISNEETCFAITIHKSQGSEFDRILVLLPDYDTQVLSKELVYTAVTRARNHVLLQSDERVLKKAVTRSVKRGSGLKDRFKYS